MKTKTSKAKDPTKTHTKPVLVCTEKRGVFFGYADPNEFAKHMKMGKAAPFNLPLRARRMCVYWSRDMRGIQGLMTQGPSASCRVTPAAPALALCVGVTDMAEVSAEAVAKWEAGPWGG